MGIFRSIEHWASERDERIRFLIILIWVGFGVLTLLSTLIAGWIMLPPDFKLF
jgi:hypothetical protein